MRRMSGWIRDQHAERDWGNNLHSVCCWDVHASVDVWVSSVHGWVRDELVGCSRRKHVYGVRCWAVQPRVNDALHSVRSRALSEQRRPDKLSGVRSRIDDGYPACGWRLELHAMCAWTIHQHVHDGVRRVRGRIGD